MSLFTLVVIGEGPLFAQSSEKPHLTADGRDAKVERVYPSLPDAVYEEPEWLRRDAAFDIAGFLAPVSQEERRSAQLYIDSLYECSPNAARKCVSIAEYEASGAMLKSRE